MGTQHFKWGKIVKLKGIVRAVSFLAVLLAATGPALADSAAGFYRGKVVKLLVGYGAGGGYDAYARLLAPHLEKQLGATVVVENRPGGGGIIALNQVAAAVPDGLTIMIISAGSTAFSQIIEAEGVRYDTASLGLLGRVAEQKRSVLWSTRSPYRTLEDAQKTTRPILFGGISRADTIAATTAFIAKALDLDAKIITGYKGTKEVALAAIRGEVDGFAVSSSSAQRYIRDGNLVASFVVSRERSPLLPDTPSVYELVDLEPEQEWWLDYTASLLSLGRALVTTPNVPQARLEYLQKAVANVLTDPDVIAEAESKKRPIAYASPEAFKSLVDTVVGSLTAEDLERVRRVALESYQ